MLIDGLTLIEGTSVANLVVTSGSSFPSEPDQGELFYLSVAQEFFPTGMYFYTGLEWTQVTTSTQLNEVASAATTVTSDAAFPTPAVNGQLFYKTTADVNGDAGLYVYQESDSTWHAVSSGAEITNHINDATLHLTSAQNTLIDAITATSTEINYLSGVTSSVQTQLSNKQPLDADLTSIAALTGTSGFLTKTAADTWSLDTSTYLTGNQSITVSGDASGSGTTSIALTLANSGVTAGTYNNSATQTQSFTVDVKGRITSTGVATTITPAWSSITSKPTTLSGFGITDAVNTSSLGAASGVATLDSSGLVPSAQLPSYVDDVLEYADLASLPVSGASGKIYIALDSGKIYRWTGSTYIEINSSVGSSDQATKLTTARSISATGDASWTVNFDGSANVTAALTLANSGVTAGTYKSVTVDAKGRVTSGSNPTTLAGYGITDAQALDADLTAIAALAGTSGFLKKTAADTWSLDTSTYLTSYTETDTLSTVTSRGATTATAISLTNSTASTSTSTGALVVTGGVGVSGTVTAANLATSEALVTSATLTTSATTANQVVTSLSSTVYRLVKFTVQVTSGSSYQASEILAIHDGTTVSFTENMSINIGASLATFDLDISGGNVRLLVTPVNAVTTIKAIVNAIKV